MILDKIIFILEFEYNKLKFKINKAKEFWKLYLIWCDVFNKETDKRFKDKYNETFL